MYCISIKSRIFLHSWGKGGWGFHSSIYFTLTFHHCCLSLFFVSVESGQGSNILWLTGSGSGELCSPQSQNSNLRYSLSVYFPCPPPPPIPQGGEGEPVLYGQCHEPSIYIGENETSLSPDLPTSPIPLRG